MQRAAHDEEHSKIKHSSNYVFNKFLSALHGVHLVFGVFLKKPLPDDFILSVMRHYSSREAASKFS